MALRAGYWGIKKLLSPLKLFKPGELGIDQDVLFEDLDQIFFPRSEQRVLGAKNRLKFPFSYVKTWSQGTWSENTYTINGLELTFTVDAYGYIERFVINNQANADTTLALANISYLPYGTYKLVGNASGWGNDSFFLGLRVDWSKFFTFDALEKQFTKDATNPWNGLYIQIKSGYTCNNLTFSPMFLLPTDTDTTYTPYAMTNKELTDAISNISAGWDYSSNTLIDTGKKWIDGKSIYCYVKTFDQPVEVSYNSWTGILDNVSTVIGKNVLNVLSLQGIGSGTYGGCTPYLAYYDDTNNKINALSTRNAVNTTISKAILMFTADDASTPEAVSATRSTKKSTTKKTAEADINE